MALRRKLGLGLVDLRLRGLEGGFTPLEFGAADEVLVLQRRVALEVGGRQVAVGGRGVELGARGVGSQLVVLRVQLSQHLARLHALAQFGLAAGDLAGHAKAQAGLDAGPHLAGKLMARLEAVDAHGEHLDGSHRLQRRLGFGAGRQRQGGDESQAERDARRSLEGHFRHDRPELKVRGKVGGETAND